MTPTLGQAARELDRLKTYLNLTDDRYAAIEVVCPTVQIGKGLASLQSSMVALAQFSVPSELEDIPREGTERLAKVTDAIHAVEAQLTILRSCVEHIKSGAPIEDSNSSYAMAARLVRSASRAGESVEANALQKYLDESIVLAQRKVDVLKEKKFRVANACEMSHVKNRLKYLTALLQLSRQTPASVLANGVVETAISLGNKELNDLSARLNSYYAKNGPAS
ncbi:hypothetical protein WKW77_30650 [Variovorax ureilyticus]|uniref:Uncharacterized protein n=1 Tax=Variovorax ureilyticus TaxID=1836198 RepID=A0ABU8VP77_9BURK